jgi:Pyruvate/2-oxoacid:ferredoxin oxidoreductase delta subunit/DNA-binding transcriptional ArsR family regulator
MLEHVYKKLADRLDALPYSFPATESGVELKLLEKIFSPEEASLASVMRLVPETAAEIGSRIGLDPETTLETLQVMRGKGLIERERIGEDQLFALRYFVIGIYGVQLSNMDEEVAELMEQYFQDSKGELLRPEPAIHRVIPVGEAIPVKLEIFPYESAAEMLEKSRSWGVQDCICRVQQQLTGSGCEHTINNCLAFAPIGGAFDGSKTFRSVSKEGALEILLEAAQQGLIHSTSNFSSGNTYICNCCSCSCGILRGITEFSIPSAAAHSNFYTVVDEDLCNSCLECEERCQFGAISILEEVPVVDYSRCMGCGSCATVCIVDALHLERRPDEDIIMAPTDSFEWRDQRMKSRGLPSSKVL